jgi:Zn-dependent peptidase ImmA (M78 family)
MDARLIEHGSGAGLRFRVQWEHEDPCGTAAEATRGELELWLGDVLVWGKSTDGKSRGFSWTWIEMVEFLSGAWPYLSWEELDPLHLDVPPGQLRAAAEQRWDGMPGPDRDQEEQALWAFEETHDLARAVQGAWPQSVFLLKEGDGMWVHAGARRLRCRAQAVLSTLADLGDSICNRINCLSDPRSVAALAGWNVRAQRSTEELVSIATGLRTEEMIDIAGGLSFSVAWGIPANDFQLSEVQAAARMVGGILAPEQIRKVLNAVRGARKVSTENLDALSAEAIATLAKHSASSAFDQGYELAIWFRARQNASIEARVEPSDILTSWEVAVSEIRIDNPRLDAVSCWGPQHGPAIFVNKRGAHNTSRGRRATLAHEICHILIDRKDALPLGEALGGSAPKSAEQRARAFAAEFLLPRRVAFQQMIDATEPKQSVDKLCKEYGVSRVIVAWQAKNGAAVASVPLPPKTNGYLKKLVPERWRF